MRPKRIVSKRKKSTCVAMNAAEIPKSDAHSDDNDCRGSKIFQGERLQFEMLLSNLSAKFVNIKAHLVKKEIKNAIEQVADFFDFDRVGFAEFEKTTNALIIIHHYARPGIPQFETRIPEASFPRYSERLRSGEIIQFSKLEEIPEDLILVKVYCKKIGLKSNLSIPIAIGGNVLCVISLDSFRSECHWPDGITHRLLLLGEIFANALQRMRMEKDIQEALISVNRLKEIVEAERDYLRDEIKLNHNFEDIIGESEALKYVLYKVEQVAPTDTLALILGETGTGKELIARAVHSKSKRKSRPLIKLNCAALASNLIESELFGHERGAFSGAHERRIGRFELADGGSLFLDEIGELPLNLQVKLLRVLQEGEFERLGSSKSMTADVRIIAATNRDLEKEIQAGRFRQDLWYRINRYPISVPPLRQRKDDIPILTTWFVHKYNKVLGKNINVITSKTMSVLEKYDWPGNVRELENIIERSAINSTGSVLNISNDFDTLGKSVINPSPLKTLQESQRGHISSVLNLTKGKIYGSKGAASILNLHPETLRAKMRKLGIQKKDFG